MLGPFKLRNKNVKKYFEKQRLDFSGLHVQRRKKAAGKLLYHQLVAYVFVSCGNISLDVVDENRCRISSPSFKIFR